MRKLSDLEYLKLSKSRAFMYRLLMFFCAIPVFLMHLIRGIGHFFVKCFTAVGDELADIGSTFIKGNWAVKLSCLIFGFGNIFYGQVARGLLFLLFEVIFIGYMIVPSGGIYWLQKGN